MAEPKKKRKDHDGTLALRDALYKRIILIAKDEGVGINALAYMIGANASLGSTMKKNKDMSLYTLIRIMYALGYEITISKSDNPIKWSDDKVLTQRYETYKTKQLNAKRRERGQPENSKLIRVRTKGKPANESRVVIISRKSIRDVQDEQDDIFSVT